VILLGKQVLGILMKQRELALATKGKGYERVDHYLLAAKKYKINICFFCLSGINNQKGTALVYFKKNNRWVRRRISIPKVIHNRAKLSSYSKKKYKKIAQKHEVTFYNYWNNYSKLHIHNIIFKNSSLRGVLPTTHSFSKENLSLYLRYPSFFLKPDRGSVGKGIIKVKKRSLKLWDIHSYRKKRRVIKTIQEKKLFSYLSKYVGSKKYILQKTIDLKTYHKRPFDLRVSVQKNRTGNWRVTGIVGKVAAKRSYLSNVYQGGTTATLNHLFSGSSLKREVEKNLSIISL
jgi:hypothetical protein